MGVGRCTLVRDEPYAWINVGWDVEWYSDDVIDWP
jgi:hypothetical protein